MSSSDRRVFLIGSLLTAAGCGFSPVMAPGGSAEALRGRVDIADPSDPEGFALVRQLELRLGLAQAPDYRLNADIRVSDQGIGILQDQTISRYNVLGRVDYLVTDIATGARMTGGEVRNFTSYSATSTNVATTAARRDARERLMVSLADQIVDEMLLSSPEWLA